MADSAKNQRNARGTVNLESIAHYAERIGLRASLAVGIALALLVLLLNLDRNPIPMLEDNRSFGLLALYFTVPASLMVAGIAFVLGVNAWNARVAAAPKSSMPPVMHRAAQTTPHPAHPQSVRPYRSPAR